MSFPGNNYAPPNTFTRTRYENPLAGALESLKIPVFIGEGNESLFQDNLEIVRGSSSSIDQRIVQEDETGRAVVAVSATGQVTLGGFDGAIDKFQVRNFPIVTGDGSGTASNNRSDVAVTIDGQPIVVLTVGGTTGIVQLAQPPKPGALVRCTYFFNRSDTWITDNVSAQVDPDPAIVRGHTGLADVDAPSSTGAVINLHGDILDANGNVVVPANNVLNMVVDSVLVVITIPPRTDYTMAQIAAAITGAVAQSLTASTFVNQFGLSALLLNADYSIVVLDGSANAPIGISEGQADARTSTFYAFQGPIVDGSNGGITTTDPSHVTVKVDNVQVIPISVDGANRAVTLPVAPQASSTVTISYWFNTWQDTFDYLAHINVTSITQVGDAPGGSGYTEDADFLLKDDKIVWGTAVTVGSGIHTDGAEFFNENQVTLTLVDNRTFLTACTPVVSISGGTSVVSGTDWLLPFSPTTGNGRNTPLGQDLFQTVTNGRIDLPTNRPDLVDIYWGYSVQDALQRGKATVLKVEGNVVTLANSVEVGAVVYATFYHNLLTDNEYTLTVVTPGPSGTGAYTVADSGNNSVYGAAFNTGTKGASLTGVTVEFPSGSELKPDLHFEGVSGNQFTGPVEEIVTVEFASKVATPAKYTVPGYGPYEFIPGQSDHLRIKVRGTDILNSGGLDLTDPSSHGTGFFGILVSDEVDYTGGTVGVVGQSYDLTTAEDFTVTVDEADVFAKASPQTAVDIGWFRDAINEAASGHFGTAAAPGAASTIVLAPTFPAALIASTVDDYYVGWRIVIGSPAAGIITPGQVGTVTGYVGSTETATVSAPWLGGAPAIGDIYHIYNPAARSAMKGATFFGPVTIVAALHDKLKFIFTGSVSGPLTGEITLTPGSYGTANTLATEVQTQITAVLPPLIVASPVHSGLDIECTPDGDGRLEFRIQLPGADSEGFLQFVDSTNSPAEDFAVTAGLDTAPAVGGGQAALLQCVIARTYECPDVSAPGDQKLFDRLILRNRLLPGGSGSMTHHNITEQSSLVVKSGNDKTGMSTGDSGIAGGSAAVESPTLIGRVGFTGGQNVGTGEPLVTFYNGTGTVSANDTFEVEMDGNAFVVSFTSSSTGTATDLGPASGTSNGSIMDQIIDALAAIPGVPFGNAAAVFAAGMILQEGAGIRLTSPGLSQNARVAIGDATANSDLGFPSGATALRTLVDVDVMVSGLMADLNSASFSGWMYNVPSGAATDFASAALANIEIDAAGQEYLYLQDGPTIVANLGTSSTLGLFDTFQSIDNALRYDTRLGAQSGDGGVGEDGLDGYFVTSTNPSGSGSAHTSILNDGAGQDGVVGQTYRDQVTGLTFTILPRGWSSNQTGPWISYPTGAAASFRFNVSKTFITNANIPHNALGGVETRVSNTTDVAIGDTSIVDTHERGGFEPAVGDLYYASYVYQKQDFGTSFYTKMSAVEQAYGVVSVDNPVSLAAYLAFTNGAVLLGIRQVVKAEGAAQASLEFYRDAIDDLEGTLPGNVRPDIITPLRGDSTSLYQYLKRSNEIQSSIRYKSERTSIIGMSAGSLPEDTVNLAQVLGHDRMRLVYPDVFTFSLQDSVGNIEEQLADGPMLAAMLIGSTVSPNMDVATPWTNRRLVGGTQLARVLDAVQQNQLAVRGVTVLEDRPPFFRVRHGLTTNMDTILTKTPTIRLIADEVQLLARTTLDQFIGIKFLPGILSQIEGRLAMMLKGLVKGQIIAAYTGIGAKVASDDPTVAEVEAWYQPIFPLLYIVVTFHLRTSL